MYRTRFRASRYGPARARSRRDMRRPPAAPLLLMVVVLASASLVAPLAHAGLPVGPPELPCVPHPPIRITEDVGPNGFVLSAGAPPVYRPGSGVTRGTGTQSDPYVIEGFCIEQRAEAPALEIRGTRLPIVVRAMGFKAETHASAVSIVDAWDVTVEESTLRAPGTGMGIAFSPNATVRKNAFDGGFIAFYGTVVPDLVVSHNTLRDASYGIDVGGGARAQVVDNVLEDSARAIRCSGCSDGVVSRNHVRGASAAILVTESPGAVVAWNDAAGSSSALTMRRSSGGAIVENALEAPSPFLLADSTGVRVEGNALRGGALGITGSTASAYLHQVAPNNTEDDVLFRYVREQWGGTIDGGVGSLLIAGSNGVIVTNQSFEGRRGIVIAHSDLVEVSRSAFTNGARAVDIVQSTRTSVHHNRFIASSGVGLINSNENSITDNHFDGEGSGCIHVRLYFSQLNGIARNRLERCHTAIEVGPTGRSNHIAHNSIHGNEYAIRGVRGGFGSMGTIVEWNDITGNAQGVVPAPFDGFAVRWNNFGAHSVAAVAYTGVVPLPAENNWWGCTEGPGAPGCDVASGDVDHTPWLREPVSAAGAG